MNKTMCNGKFIFQDTLTEEQIADVRKWDEGRKDCNIWGKKLTDEEISKRSRNGEINRRICAAVMKYLEFRGYEPYDVNSGNGYFIFEMGEDSVVSFNLSGFWLNDYRFGMWIDADKFLKKDVEEMTDDEKKNYYALPNEEKSRYYEVVQIFQQHGDYINKFKPSRSEPVVSLSKYDVSCLLERTETENPTKEQLDKWNSGMNDGYGFGISYLDDVLVFMKRHPFMHFAGYLRKDGIYFAQYMRDFDFAHPFLGFMFTRGRFYFDKAERGIRHWLGFRKAFGQCRKLASEDCVKTVKMRAFDCVVPGCSTSYEYQIDVMFKEGTSDETIEDVLGWYFDDGRIGKLDRNGYDHVAEIVHVRVENDGKDDLDDD